MKKTLGNGKIAIGVITMSIFDKVVWRARQAKVQIVAFDFAGKVTIAKQPEQKTRDNTIVIDASYSMCSKRLKEALRRNDIERIEFSKEEWAFLINDRASRKMVIIALCKNAATILPIELARRNTMLDCRIIIDYEDGEQPPVVITHAGAEDNEGFRNDLGEFDVKARFWEEIARNVFGSDIVIHESEDTDLIVIGLLKHLVGERTYIKTTVERKPV